MRQYSWLTLLAGALALTGCATTHVQEHTARGAATGALIGAIIGHHEGNTGEGLLIGAGIGAITGAIIGDAEEQRYREYRREPVVYGPPPPPAYPAPRVYAPPPPAPVPIPPTHSSVRSYKLEDRSPENGHWEVQVLRSPAGEQYEERVWIPDR